MTKEEIKAKELSLIELSVAFCKQKLNEEYAELCEKLIKKMGRKREVPFLRGKLEIWAAAVVYAIGSINFLFDKAQNPHVKSSEIADFFDVNSSTMAQKGGTIRNMFQMDYYDSEFSTSRMADSNPFNSYVMVNERIVSLSSLPEEYQKMVREARSQGKDISLSTK